MSNNYRGSKRTIRAMITTGWDKFVRAVFFSDYVGACSLLTGCYFSAKAHNRSKKQNTTRDIQQNINSNL